MLQAAHHAGRRALLARLRSFAIVVLAIAVCLAAPSYAQAQATYTYSGSSTSWLTGAGWVYVSGTSYTGQTYPGTTTGLLNTDIAIINGDTGSTFNINFGSGGTFSLATISISNSQANALTIGNSSSSNNGTLYLNGSTVNGYANTIFSDFSQKAFTISGTQSSKTLTLDLVNTNNVIQVISPTASGSPTGKLSISANIADGGAGNALQLLGNGSTTAKSDAIIALSGTNNFTGGITLGDASGMAGTTYSGAELDLMNAASLPTSGTITVNTNSALIISVSGSLGGASQNLSLFGGGAGGVTQNAALDFEQAAIWSGTVTLNSGATKISVSGGSNNATLAGLISGAGTSPQLQKTGGGTLHISGANNSGWATDVTNGAISVESSGALGTGSLTVDVSGHNASMVFNNTTQSVGSLLFVTGTNSGTMNLNGTLLQVSQTTDQTFGQSNFSITGTGGLALLPSSTNTLTLSAANAYTGGTTIGGGTLAIGASGALASAGAVTVSGGSLNVTTFSQTVGGFTMTSGMLTGTTGNITLNGGNFALQSGTVAANLAGTAGVSKTGSSGTVTLSVASGNAYGGGTIVSAGTLFISNTSGSALGSAGVSVADSAALASGATASVTGAVTLGSSTGATLNVGGGAIGTLTLGNGLAINGNSTLVYTLGASNASSLLDVVGNVTFSGATTISLAGTLTNGQYEIMSYSGTLTGLNNLHAIAPGLTTAFDNTSHPGELFLDITGGGQTLTWSPAAGAGNGNVWDTSHNTFTNSSGVLTNWANGGTDTAVFGTGGSDTGGTVTLSSSVPTFSADGLIFNAIASGHQYTLTGSSPLALFSLGVVANDSAQIAAPVLLTAGQTWTTTTGAALAVSGPVGETGGSQSLTIGGSGTTVLSGVNTYSGGTAITGGTVRITNSQSLGIASGGLTLGSATLEAAASINSSRSLTLSSANSAVFVDSGATYTLGGTITGGGALNVAGPGTLVLTEAINGYSGGTGLDAGTLSVATNGSLGSTSGGISFNGGALQITADGFSSARSVSIGGGGATFDVVGSASATFSGAVNVTSALTKVEGGTLNLTGTGNNFSSYLGAVNVAAGTLSASSTGQVNATLNVASGATFALNGGTVNLGDGTANITDTINGTMLFAGTRLNLNGAGSVLTGSGTIEILNNGAVISNTSGTIGGTIATNVELNPNNTSSFVAYIGGTKPAGLNLSISGLISGNATVDFANGSGGGGAASILLSNQNSWTGDTRFDTAGTVQLGNNNVLPIGTAVIMNYLAAGNAPVLDLGGYNQQIASLASPSDPGSGGTLGIVTNGGGTLFTTSVLTISGSGSLPPATFYGTINDGLAGVAIIKDGTNTEAFAGSNIYSQGTTINGGMLVAANGSNGSAFGYGAITVNAGASLAGDATVGGSALGAVTVNSGGTISAGNGGINTLTLSGGVTLNSGSILHFDLASGTSSEIDLGFSSMAITSGNTIVDVSGTGLAAGQSYTLVTDGSIDESFGTFTLAEQTLSGFSLSLKDTGSELDLLVSAGSGRNLLWSNNGTSNGDGSGIWNNSNTNWWTGASSTTWQNSGPDNATFGASPSNNGGTVTLGSNITAGVVTFAPIASPYTIAGGGFTLSVATGIVVDNSAIIQAPIVITSSETWTSTTGAVLTVTGPIGEAGGSQSLAFGGSGTIDLLGTNAYSGGTTINAGTVQINSASSLGNTAGGLTIGAGTLEALGTITSSRNVTLSSAASAIFVDSGATYTLNGNLAGTGALNVAGPGTLVLGGSNGFSGGTNLQAGTLSVANANGLGSGATVAFNGGALQTVVGVSSGSSLAIVNGGTFDTGGVASTFTGNLTGAGSLAVVGGGSLVMAGGGNGNVNLSGSLSIASGTSLVFAETGNTQSITSGFSAFAGNLVLAGATVVQVGGHGLIDGGGQVQFITSGAGLIAAAAAGVTVNNAVMLNTGNAGSFTAFLGATSGGTLTVASNISGTADVLISNSNNGAAGGKGALVLAGNDSYTGITQLLFNNSSGTYGVLQLGSNTALPSTTTVVFGTGSNGTAGLLDMAGFNATVAGISAPVANAGGSYGGIVNSSGAMATLTIQGAANDTYASTIGGFLLTDHTNSVSASISGSNIALVLASANTGTLTLSGANLYTGGTTVSGGMLVAANGVNGSALGTGDVTVSGGTLASAATGATIGAGTSNITINNGGNLSVGNGSIGALTIAGNLTGASGSTFSFALGPTNTSSEISVSGNLVLGAGTTANLTGLTVGTFALVNFGNDTGNTSFASIIASGFNTTEFFSGNTLEVTLAAAVANLVWSSTPNAANASQVTDGSGTWTNLGANNFWNGTSATSWNNAALNNVTFGANTSGTGGTITLGSAIAVGSLVLAPQSAATGYTFVGNGNSLTIATGIVANNSGTIAVPIVISSSETWTTATGATLTVSGNISETGGGQSLNFGGSGTVLLSGTNSYSGGTVISGGTLGVASDASLGASTASVTLNGGALATAAPFSSARTFTASSATSIIDTTHGDLTISGPIEGTGVLTKAGTGTLTLSATGGNSSSPAHTIAGGLAVQAGTVALAAADGYNLTFSTTVNNAGRIDVATALNINTKGTMDFDGSGQLRFLDSGASISEHSSGTLTINNEIVLNPNDVVPAASFYTAIGSTTTLVANAPIIGDGGVLFAVTTSGGSGVIQLNAQSSYTGNTILATAKSGTVQLGISNALPTSANLTFGNAGSAAGSLDLAGFNQQVGSLATDPLTPANSVTGIINSNTNSTSIFTVNGSTNTTYIAAIGTTSVNGNVALDKEGTGTLTLTAANLYTGGTTIGGGVLVAANAANSALGTGNVTVNVGGTLRSDTAGTTISGIVADNGGTVAVAGNLSLSSGLALASGSVVGFNNVGGGNGAVDLLNGSTLTLSPGTETISLSGSVTGAGSYTLISYGSGTYTGALGQFSLNETNLSLSAGLTAQLFDNTALSEIDLVVTNSAVASGNLIWTASQSQLWNTTQSNWIDSGTSGAATFANTNTVTFTDTGAGTVTVSNGGVALAPANVTITTSAAYTFTGDPINSTGTLTKLGSGSLWLADTQSYAAGVSVAAGTLTVGSTGSLSAGTLSVSTGATASFQNTSQVLGNATNSGNLLFTNAATISSLTGAGSSTFSSDATITTFSSGNATIAGAASVGTMLSGNLTFTGFSLATINTLTGTGNIWVATSSTFLSVGGGSFGGAIGGGGSVTFSGNSTLAGATVSVGGINIVGVGASLNVINGTYLTTRGVAFGDFGTATISGVGTTVSLANGISVGGTGGNGQLTLSGGATLNASSMAIGSAAGATGAATVSGNGTQLSVGSIYAGGGGTGSLTISGGAFVYGGDLHLGDTSVHGGTAFVTDAGSQMDIGYLYLGQGANSSVTITNGALMIEGADAAIGGSAGSTGTVTVSGTGSQWQLNLGALSLDRGSITVSGGATVTGTSLVGAYIGSASGGTGNVTITGTGSTWTSSSMYVGGNNNSAQGTGNVTVTAGGALTITGSGSILKLWTNGKLVVGSGSTVTAPQIDASLGTLSLSGGTLAISGATTNTLSALTGTGGLTLVQSGTQLTISGGSFGGSINGLGSVTTTGTVTFSGTNSYAGGTTVSSGTLAVISGGSLSATGTLSIASGATASFTNAAQTLGTVTDSGNLVFANAATISNLNGAGVLTTSGALTVAGGSFGGNITGSGGLVSTGNLTLTGNSSYSGGTTVSSGVLTLANGGHWYDTNTYSVAVGAGLNVQGVWGGPGNIPNLNVAGTATFSGGGYGLTALNGASTGIVYLQTGTDIAVGGGGSYGGQITGGGQLWTSGGSTSTLTLTGTNNNYSGGTLLFGGTIAIASGTSVGTGTITFSGGTIADYAGSFTLANNLWGTTTNGGIFVDSGLTLTSTGTIGGSTAITKLGSGTLVLLGTNSGSTPVIVDGGTVSGNAASFGNNPIELFNGGTVVFDQTGGAGTFGGAITGTGNVVIDGTLTLTNAGSNYSGTTTLNAATLTIANGGDLGTQGLAMNGSDINSTTGSYTAATTLSGANIWNVGTSGTFTDAGAINGSGSFNKTGLGAFIAGAAGNFSGGLTVSQGVLVAAANQALGSGAVTVSSGASLVFTNTGNYTDNNPITISGTGLATVGAALAFVGNNSFGGNITVGGATSSSANIGLAPGSNTTLAGVLTKDGRTLEFDAGGANVNVNITGALTGTSTGSDVIFNGNNQSTADFTVSSPQNYNGPTDITNGSTLFLGASNVLPGNGTYPSNPRTDLTLTSSSATSIFDLHGFSDTVRTLSSDGHGVVTDSSATGSTLSVSPTAAAYSTFAGQVTGNMSLVFSGVANSAEVFSGTSSYAGTTNINSGALLVSGSVTSGGTVTVNSSATSPGILAGSGTVAAPSVVVAGDGNTAHDAVLSPGNSNPNVGNTVGILNVASNLTVSGEYLWDLTSATNSAAQAGVAYDQVALGGHAMTMSAVAGTAPVLHLNFGAGAAPTNSAFWNQTEVWNIVTGISALNGYDSADVFTIANNQTLNGYSFVVQFSGTNEQLVWTPVPEPGSLMLGALAAAGLGAHALRRRRRKAKELAASLATR
ncbi:MAG TPA: autotransporter-associated beta strand repeat-containing protein [Pirellulales bacterium]|jgi:autotransporter-associated beta strand protein|nr:autotransporter-associated beta strand repeat-containing protein [Pirellulales bacterium]